MTEKLHVNPIPGSIKQSKELDVIWMLDDSASMEGYQKLLSNSVPELLEQFYARSELSFRMAIVTTNRKVVSRPMGCLSF